MRIQNWLFEHIQNYIAEELLKSELDKDAVLIDLKSLINKFKVRLQ